MLTYFVLCSCAQFMTKTLAVPIFVSSRTPISYKCLVYRISPSTGNREILGLLTLTPYIIIRCCFYHHYQLHQPTSYIITISDIQMKLILTMHHHQSISRIILAGSSWHKRYIQPRKVSHFVPLISSWPSLTMDSEWERAHQDHTALASHQPQPVLSRL